MIKVTALCAAMAVLTTSVNECTQEKHPMSPFAQKLVGKWKRRSENFVLEIKRLDPVSGYGLWIENSSEYQYSITSEDPKSGRIEVQVSDFHSLAGKLFDRGDHHIQFQRNGKMIDKNYSNLNIFNPKDHSYHQTVDEYARASTQ